VRCDSRTGASSWQCLLAGRRVDGQLLAERLFLLLLRTRSRARAWRTWLRAREPGTQPGVQPGISDAVWMCLAVRVRSWCAAWMRTANCLIAIRASVFGESFLANSFLTNG